MTLSDFSTPNPSTVSLSFSAPTDPQPPPQYASHPSKALPSPSSLTYAPISSPSAQSCVLSCHSDLLCDCAAYDSSASLCTKARGGCEPGGLAESGTSSAVYVRPRDDASVGPGGGDDGGDDNAAVDNANGSAAGLGSGTFSFAGPALLLASALLM